MAKREKDEFQQIQEETHYDQVETYLEDSGALKKKFHPAVYVDSSFLIDYWICEYVDVEDAPEEHSENSITKIEEIIRKLLKSDKRLDKVADIRRKYLRDECKVIFVTSSPSLWELQEWYSETNFKQYAAQFSGASSIQRMGKKEIGRYLKNIRELRVNELKLNEENEYTTPLEVLLQETNLNFSYLEAHGLRGIIRPPLINFNIPPKDFDHVPDPYFLSYLQFGMADIMHLLFAKHLGCKYFASFDSDFVRGREEIESTGLEVLTNPDEILEIL